MGGKGGEEQPLYSSKDGLQINRSNNQLALGYDSSKNSLSR